MRPPSWSPTAVGPGPFAVALGFGLALAGASSVRAAPPPGCAEPLVAGAAEEACEPAVRQGDQVPDLNALKTPESPAFMALGLAPSQIQRPTTPTGLALALATGVAQGTGILPGNDFALEVSPYWLVQHPRLTAQDLEQQRWRSIYRNFSLSAAITTRKVDLPIGGDQTMPTDLQQAALGIRTTLAQGRLSEAALACRVTILEFTSRDVVAGAEAEQTFLADWEAKDPKPASPFVGPAPRHVDFENEADFVKADDEYRAKKEKLVVPHREWLQRRRKAIEAWRETFEPTLPAPSEAVIGCLDDIHHRRGFMAELAGAWAVTAAAGDLGTIDESGGQSQTGWLTVGSIWNHHVGALRRALDVSALGVGRIQHETVAMLPEALRLDGGARLVLAWERYGFSGEGLIRHERLADAEDDVRWRAAITVDYRLLGGTWITVTFGKDFGTEAASTPILALGNLQWNFGRERALRPDTSLTAGSRP